MKIANRLGSGAALRCSPIWAALALSVAMIASSVKPAAAIEIIPSVGVTKSVDSNAGDPKAYGGIALRSSVLPFLKVEGGIAYRQEDVGGSDDIKLRMWPVTVSGWLSPFPMVYAGGGVGWYRTTVDFDSSLPLEDETNTEMGVHVGGGVSIPLSSRAGLDLHGRYIFMQNKDDLHIPTEFDPDFWSTSLGLVIKL